MEPDRHITGSNLVSDYELLATLDKMPSEFTLYELIHRLGIRPRKGRQSQLGKHLEALGYTKHLKHYQGITANYWSKSQ